MQDDELPRAIALLGAMEMAYLRHTELKHLSAEDRLTAYEIVGRASQHKTRLIELNRMITIAETESEELDRKVEAIEPAIKLAIRKQKADEKAAS